MVDLFSTKSPQWRYEDEYRYIRKLENAAAVKPPDIYRFKFPAQCVRSVIFGKRCCESALQKSGPEALEAIRAIQERLERLPHIRLFRADMDRREYKLNILELISPSQIGADFDVATCPYCNHDLLTIRAKQCFTCGMDWHDPNHPVHRGSVP